jgi:hypothetical protein
VRDFKSHQLAIIRPPFLHVRMTIHDLFFNDKLGRRIYNSKSEGLLDKKYICIFRLLLLVSTVALVQFHKSIWVDSIIIVYGNSSFRYHGIRVQSVIVYTARQNT